MLNFLSVLSESPSNGHAFIISGRILDNATQFSVSLACGKSPNSDVALMFLTNFVEGQITRSSLTGGNWTSGESSESPIAPGLDFKIKILIAENKFHVTINDESFCEYDFKVAASSIQAISVSGDVEAITQMDHQCTIPTVYPLVSDGIENIVFSAFIPKKYQPGTVVVVSGVPTGNLVGEFAIMFNEENRIRQLVHFNARFDEQSVVMNTMDTDEDWSDAEIHTEAFPFAIDQPFKVAFGFTESECKVAVNGNHLMTFSLDEVSLEDGQFLYDILTGFQIKVGNDCNVSVNHVEYIQTNANCDGLENYSN